MSGWRRAAATATMGLAALIVLGVVVQVYLAGAYVFGAGADVLDAHKDIGWMIHTLELAVLVVALVARSSRDEVLLAVGLAVLGTVQVMLAQAEEWAGGLHPLFALLVLGLAGALVTKGRERRRLAV